MWYDQFRGVPKRNSPLETLFVLVHLARRDAELLATSAQVRIALANFTKSAETAQRALDTYERYAQTLMPFLDAARRSTATDHQRLMEHIQHPMEIDIQSIRHESQKQARKRGLEKFKLRKTL